MTGRPPAAEVFTGFLREALAGGALGVPRTPGQGSSGRIAWRTSGDQSLQAAENARNIASVDFVYHQKNLCLEARRASSQIFLKMPEHRSNTSCLAALCDGGGPWQGRGHHRQAPPRTNQHR